jgi:hypothetical protein
VEFIFLFFEKNIGLKFLLLVLFISDFFLLLLFNKKVFKLLGLVFLEQIGKGFFQKIKI